MSVSGRPFQAVSAILLILLLVSCQKIKSKEDPVSGDKSPDFTLVDLNGNKVRLSDFSGKVVMLEFWASWCLPCRDSISEMNALYRKYKDRGFILLGLSMDKSKEDVDSFVKEYPVEYPVLHDNADVNVLYGVYSIPTVVIIDKKGRLAAKHAGFNPYLGEKLSKEIEGLL